ncbi:MAG: electron transfer flavoprotein subunit alpha/FixB family protein [Desulfomonile tiedjei]|nr:electron transfer flavoprotein subunit alpha/FixB family protein [Desulfomonile tiedjei]
MTEIIESKIWVFIEQRQGRMAEVGLEILGKAAELGLSIGSKVAGVLVGSSLASLSDQVLSYGVDEVLVADNPLLTDYCNQAYVKVLEQAVSAWQPEILLLGATAMGTDLAPRLAARLRTGLSAHCIDLHLTAEGELLSVVPGWGGNVMARVSCPRTRPQVATVMPGVFSLPDATEARGRKISVETLIEPADITYRTVEVKREEAPKGGLETAEVVVAGGWGVGTKADWRYIEELALVLNAAVGATRPPVDEGWAEEKQMIGQSGRTIRPRLYIGVGISGHMHHLVGLKDPELIVAINGDPNAAIFDHCHLALVGDFKEIVPALIEKIKSYSSAQ